MQSASFSGQANAKYQAELEAVTKRYGFKDFAEYEAVAANIWLVMAQIDPQTKMFADPGYVVLVYSSVLGQAKADHSRC
jgi:hypothetical protein